MAKVTRAEHMQWCKRRALEILDADPMQFRQATASMCSDLRKHEETSGLLELAGVLVLTVQDPNSARSFIEGFA